MQVSIDVYRTVAQIVSNEYGHATTCTIAAVKSVQYTEKTQDEKMTVILRCVFYKQAHDGYKSSRI